MQFVKVHLLIICLAISILISFSAKSETVKMATYLSKPYQVAPDGKPGGSSIDLMNCIENKVGFDSAIEIFTPNRAAKQAEKGKVDIYFLSSNNTYLNKTSILTSPMFVEKWYLVSLHPLSVNDYKSVAVLKYSNQETWLNSQGIKPKILAKTFYQLFELIKKGRVKAALVNLSVFQDKTKLLGLDIKKLKYKFVLFKQLGAYISKKFLLLNPDFLTKFNKAIYACSSQIIKLNQSERYKIKDQVSLIKQWVEENIVLNAIDLQNRKNINLTKNQINELDKKWKQERESKYKPVIKSILNNKLSKFLKTKQDNSNGLYTEIFVMDNKGINVGQSVITSDYWQGDEAKFKKTYSKGINSVFIGDIMYDESSRQFQSQISMTIVSPDTGKAIGAITVGVNVEKVFLE